MKKHLLAAAFALTSTALAAPSQSGSLGGSFDATATIGSSCELRTNTVSGFDFGTIYASSDGGGNGSFKTANGSNPNVYSKWLHIECSASVTTIPTMTFGTTAAAAGASGAAPANGHTISFSNGTKEFDATLHSTGSNETPLFGDIMYGGTGYHYNIGISSLTPTSGAFSYPNGVYSSTVFFNFNF